MNITVNGNPHEMAPGTTIVALLESLAINPDTVVVELDKNIISREDYSTSPLQDGSMVELIRFVGGG